jgi:exonuclease SbcD
MTEAEDVPVDPSALPPWSYAALGHLHKPQAVVGNQHLRYSGSPIRMDAGETSDEKSCVLVELDPLGNVLHLELLPLPARPVYSVELETCEGFEQLPEFYADHAEALVTVKFSYRPGVDSPGEALGRLREIFPYMYGWEPRPLGQETIGRRLPADRKDLAGTVAAYLEGNLEDHPRREALLALARDMVEEAQGAAAAT